MPAAKKYVVLHDFHTRINDNTGEEKAYKVGDVYDGPASRLESLLSSHTGQDGDGSYFHGPLIAEQASDSGKEN